MSTNESETASFGGEMALKIAIAKLYYIERRSKLQIAESLGLSRFKVARLLQAAEDEGIVQIRIREIQPESTDTAAELRERFGLITCVVVPTPKSSEDALREALGEAAATLLGRVLTEQDVLGVGWGRTIQAILPNLPPLPPCPVVQLSGMTGPPGSDSTEIIRRVAALTKGPAFPIYAPLLLPTPETAEDLRRMPGIAATFGMHERITTALLAIGSWNPPNSQLRIQFSHEDQAALDKLGLRAEMGGVLLDDEGRQVAGRQYAGRILAIDGARLQSIPNVIGVAGGKTKQKAIRVALSSRYVNSLVTDEETAQALLQGPPPPTSW